MAPRTLYDVVMSEFVLDETVRTSHDGRGVKVLSVDLVVIDGPSRGQRVRVEFVHRPRAVSRYEQLELWSAAFRAIATRRIR